MTVVVGLRADLFVGTVECLFVGTVDLFVGTVECLFVGTVDLFVGTVEPVGTVAGSY